MEYKDRILEERMKVVNEALEKSFCPKGQSKVQKCYTPPEING